jgi:hypothetical protein
LSVGISIIGTIGGIANDSNNCSKLGALPVYVRQGWWRSLVDTERMNMNVQNPSKEYIVREDPSSPPTYSEVGGSAAWENAGAAAKVLLTRAPMRKMRYA